MNFKITCLLLVQFLSLDGAVWEGNLNNFPKEWPITGGSCKDTCQLVKDPTVANSVNNVLHVKYPKGSCSSACGISSGVSLHISPLPESEKATLEYEVYFPADFDYVKGGKLPGIVGGFKGCTGCTRDEPLRSNCFSARFMWGPSGQGYPYLYLPILTQHTSNFCSLVGKTCDPACGMKFSPGDYFVKGKWNKIKERVVMNIPGVADGVMQVWVNDVRKLDYSGIIYRVNETVKANGFYISSFFGGSDSTWAPKKDTYTYFRNFKYSDV